MVMTVLLNNKVDPESAFIQFLSMPRPIRCTISTRFQGCADVRIHWIEAIQARQRFAFRVHSSTDVPNLLSRRVGSKTTQVQEPLLVIYQSNLAEVESVDM